MVLADGYGALPRFDGSEAGDFVEHRDGVVDGLAEVAEAGAEFGFTGSPVRDRLVGEFAGVVRGEERVFHIVEGGVDLGEMAGVEEGTEPAGRWEGLRPIGAGPLFLGCEGPSGFVGSGSPVAALGHVLVVEFPVVPASGGLTVPLTGVARTDLEAIFATRGDGSDFAHGTRQNVQESAARDRLPRIAPYRSRGLSVGVGILNPNNPLYSQPVSTD